MNTVFKIAKNEFRYLFFSPIAWFAMIVFLVQCAFYFSEVLYNVANVQDVMMKNVPSFTGDQDSLTIKIFLKSGAFGSVIGNLYIFIPLLTMGLISRELNNGTIKLLYSSPVSLRRMVFGKYIGIMLFNLILVLIVGIFIVTGICSIKQVDYGMLLSATLGFYLLVCVYSALGLFMSSLSSYQIVSCMGTFAVLFLLSRIGTWWQKYDVIRDLTYFLSLQNRTIKMVLGLITSKDVIYFVLVAGMFVAFTIFKLKAGRESTPWHMRATRYAVTLAIVLALGYLFSRQALTAYWDTTANNRNTIHPRTQEALRELGDSTLEVTLYTNLLGEGLGHGLPESRNAVFLNYWENYLRFKPDIRFRYVYYYDYTADADGGQLLNSYPGKSIPRIAEEMADYVDADFSMFRRPEQVRKEIDLKPERYRLTMQLKYKGRTALLRTYPDPLFWPDETNMIAVLKRLTGHSIPDVYFVTGNLERSIYKTGEREYAILTALKGSRGALINTGFNVDTLNLSTQYIPEGATAVVLADPKVELGPVARGKLQHYLARGGNMLISGEPGKQQVLNPVLEQLGVQLMNGQLVQPGFDETPDKIISGYRVASLAAVAEHPAARAPGKDAVSVHQTTAMGPSGMAAMAIKNDPANDSASVLMPGATGLVFSDSPAYNARPLAATIPGATWLRSGPVVADSTLPAFNSGEGDLKENSFPTMAQLTRQAGGKEQRIIISGDADYASNVRIDKNGGFTLSAYSWLCYNRFPVYTPRPLPEDVFLRITGPTAKALQVAYIWILPGLLLLACTIVLIRRKRK